MNIPSPAKVASNRTARLLAEGAHKPRLAYTSSTEDRASAMEAEFKAEAFEHLFVVEEDSLYGRHWHGPMNRRDADIVAARLSEDGTFSDFDHAGQCPCGETNLMWW